MKRLAKDYFKEEWGDLFYYDETSPSFLRWKRKPSKMASKIEVGSVAGWVSGKRWKVEYKNKPIQIHRIIYYLHHKYLENNLVVDHIDKNPANNIISNLRLVESSLNSRNKSKSINNKSGFTGVYERHEWIATWCENGEPKSKSFKVSDFGDKTKEIAEDFRINKINQLNLKNYGYTENHGK